MLGCVKDNPMQGSEALKVENNKVKVVKAVKVKDWPVKGRIKFEECSTIGVKGMQYIQYINYTNQRLLVP